ncbi:MAG: cobalamin-dependent protein, partial [DPANN group archaeon]|nr:cobalamin-dependent protein [DPANN group archaeon]
MSNVILTNIMKVRDYSCAPVSLPILASYVEHNTEADAEIFDMTLEMAKTQSYKKSLKNLEKRLDNCEVLGVHTITPNYYLVVNMLRGLKKIHGKLPTVVLGGPHATAVPVITLEQTKGLVDIMVIGPGERQLAEIVMGTPLEEIPNIAYQEGKKIKLTKRKLMEPFDEKIERKFLEFCMTPSFSKRMGKLKELSDISRYSCPNQCDYCSCVRVRGGTFNRNPDLVAEEIAEINDRKKLENIIFVDDNHFLDFNHAKALNKALIEHGIEASKTSYADLATFTKSNLQSIKKMNYQSLFVGRDFVTNRLARIYGRRLAGRIRDVEGEKKILDRAARTIPLTINYIIPAPHYTMEEVKLTVDDMCDYCWQGVRYGILSPLPGTKIREKLRKEKLLNSW